MTVILAGKKVAVTLIDKSNHHLFQPLLYQVATGALSPADIATALRSRLGNAKNINVILDEVTGVDHHLKTVSTASGETRTFDYLVLATGAGYSFFGNDQWAPHAPVLKTLDDALRIRERLLGAFEAAERSAINSDALQTFVIVGGGPTGVEMAGAIAELSKRSLAHDFRRVQPRSARIILVEAGPRILGAFSDRQSRIAVQSLEALGVEVMLNSPVEDIDPEGIIVNGERIASANVLWCAGTRARDIGEVSGVSRARNNAIVTGNDCSAAGAPSIYVIGDGASHPGPGGRPLPGLAPVAKQQGAYVGEQILRRIAGKAISGPFKYRNWGTMAVIGRSRAIADFGWLRLTGFPAWLSWSAVHLMLLVNFRSRMAVYVSWTWSWLTGDRAARLLTGRRDAPAPDTIAARSTS